MKRKSKGQNSAAFKCKIFHYRRDQCEKNQVVIFSLDNMISFCLVKQISMHNSIRKSSDLLAGMTCNFKFEKHGCNVSKTETDK